PATAPGLTSRPGLTCGVDRAEEIADGPEHRVRPLADQEMPAVGDHAQRRPQAAGVLHPVRERHPVVRRAPEAQARAGDALEVGTPPAWGSGVGAAGSGPEPPCPGNSGTITRRSSASAGATRRQFAAAPPSPWTSTRGGPEPAVK